MNQPLLNLEISHQIWLDSGPNKNLTVFDQTQQAWQLLTDFQSWNQWLPNIRRVARLDENSLGRGSAILLVSSCLGHTSSHTWTISYWDPTKRIDFIRQSQNWRGAYSIRLEPAKAALALILNLEIELRGFRKLLKPLYLWNYRHQSTRLLSSFADYWSRINA